MRLRILVLLCLCYRLRYLRSRLLSLSLSVSQTSAMLFGLTLVVKPHLGHERYFWKKNKATGVSAPSAPLPYSERPGTRSRQVCLKLNSVHDRNHKC